MTLLEMTYLGDVVIKWSDMFIGWTIHLIDSLGLIGVMEWGCRDNGCPEWWWFLHEYWLDAGQLGLKDVAMRNGGWEMGWVYRKGIDRPKTNRLWLCFIHDIRYEALYGGVLISIQFEVYLKYR